MVELHFSAGFGMVPARLTLAKGGFEGAFDAFRAREREAGRKATFETFCEDVGVNERVLRRAREGQGKLPRHQVRKMAERLGCRLGDIAEAPGAEERRLREERDKLEMARWPVPLSKVSSWLELVQDLWIADPTEPAYSDDVLSLETAASIDAFVLAFRYAVRMAPDHKAIAAATLKDAAADLEAHGLHVLVGRYMARRQPQGETWQVGSTLHRAMVVQIRREESDPGFTVDRSAEPFITSDEEDFHVDDPDVNAAWLAWEGKQRLSLWPEASSDDATP
ncbi:MAG: hypothetical protein DI532_20585 [Azospirillum brasilense]|nr:MAG: hypothetical protein DI532_20585 [Azospirillum brasilense]